MLEQQQEDCIQRSFNPTLNRITAVKSISSQFQNEDALIQEQEQKSHELFIEIAHSRRITNKLNTLDHSFLFIKNTFSDILQKSTTVQKDMISLINQYDKISDHINNMQYCLPSKIQVTNERNHQLINENSNLERQIEQIQHSNTELETAKRIEKELNTIKMNQNEKSKQKLASIKVQKANITSPHQNSMQKLKTIQNQVKQISKNNEDYNLHLFDVKYEISKIDHQIDSKKLLLKSLQNEFFIKKRVSLKMIRDLQNPPKRKTEKEKQFIDEIEEIKTQISKQISINKQLKNETKCINQKFLDQIDHNSNHNYQYEMEIEIIQDKKTRLNDLKNEEKEKERMIDSIEKEISLCNAEKIEIEQHIEELNSQVFKNENDYQELLKKYEQTEKSLQSEIKTVQNKIRLSKAKVESYKSMKNRYINLF